MTMIRVGTGDLVNAVERCFRHQPWALDGITRELEGAVGGLDTGAWAEAGCGGGGVEAQLDRVGPEGTALTEAVVGLCRTLMTVAERFEEVDCGVVQAAVDVAWADWISPSDANPGFDGVVYVEEAEADGRMIVYGFVKGRRFILGAGDEHAIHPSDVDQNQLGTCYFMSPLAALAGTEAGREVIENNIRPNDDGTYTVIFYERDIFGRVVEVPIRVTPEFPQEGGRLVFAGTGAFHIADVDGDQQEQWPMLYEKAYAQYRGGYAEIEGGNPGVAMEALTGVPRESFRASNVGVNDLADRFGAGDAIVVTSLPGEEKRIEPPWYQPGHPGGTLVRNHAYYVVDVVVDENEPGGGTVTVRNPWGWHYSPINMSFDEFQDNFNGVIVNSIEP